MSFFKRTLYYTPGDLNGVMIKQNCMNAIEILERLPQVGVNTEAYIKLDDAKFIIGQVIQEYETEASGKLRSAVAVKGFVEGLLYAREEKDPEDPTLETLRNILIYMTL